MAHLLEHDIVPVFPGEGGLKPVFPLRAVDQLPGAADKTDAPVSQVEEMPPHLIAAVEIVHQNTTVIRVPVLAVQHHKRHLLALEPWDELILHAGRQQHHAVHALLL